MIRFAPQPVPTSVAQSNKATAHIAAPLKGTLDVPIGMSAKPTDPTESSAEDGMLLAGLPEVAAKATKARSPRKPKAKLEASAVQLDLDA